jgi:hypothetical protein
MTAMVVNSATAGNRRYVEISRIGRSRPMPHYVSGAHSLPILLNERDNLKGAPRAPVSAVALTQQREGRYARSEPCGCPILARG